MEMSAKMVVMSHLSNAQEEIGFMCGSEATERINFVKYVLLQTKGDLKQDIDPDAMYSEFQAMMKQRKIGFDFQIEKDGDKTKLY